MSLLHSITPHIRTPLESHHLIHLAREIISLNTFGIALITIDVNRCALSIFGVKLKNTREAEKYLYQWKKLHYCSSDASTFTLSQHNILHNT